ncbi:hypothetical protein [Acidocella sp.]|uniref:hypothetical protein n=1 Tax=Acidocella sp. TaxID=50710 RepID=UPI002629C354|nr:hypothetical protein [Acidocella sp.]MDD2794659.1 hypothetical protein [Acidocella sp.]
MLTWLDHLCRKGVDYKDGKEHSSDPRRAFADVIGRIFHGAKTGRAPVENMLDEIFYTILMSIVAPYLPDGSSLLLNGQPPDRTLGIVLTRETANLLSDARPIEIPDAVWRERLRPLQTVYVDIPHGALTFNTDGDQGEVIELRAILAAPYLPPDMPGHTQFVVQLTDRGTERGRGRVAGVLCPDGTISLQAGDKSGLTVDFTVQEPFAHPLLHKAVLGRAGVFLRLVLAYYFFGPSEAKQPIPETSPERLRAGKPRNGESLFAMTRLHPSGKVGRPANTIPSTWNLSERQEVAGHFKLQAYGPQWSERRLIWVSGYERGPDDIPLRPKAVRL